MSVTFPYQHVLIHGLVPPTVPPGSNLRYRPLVPLRVINPVGGQFMSLGSALADSGSDDTIFPDSVAPAIGLSHGQLVADSHQLRWRGSAWPLTFANVLLELSDGRSTFRWPAWAAFSTAPIRYPILGQSSCFQYFDVTFRGAGRFVEFAPNAAFAGTIS